MKKKSINYSLFILLSMVCISLSAQEKFRVSTEIGFGYRTGSTAEGLPEEINNHYDKLRSGLNFNLQASYFFGENWGLGLTYNSLSSSNSITFSESIFINNIEVFTTSDDITILFIAPEFLYQSFFVNEKHSFITNIGVGYLGWVDQETINGFAIENKGKTIGIKLGFSYDYRVTKSIAIGASANIISGSLGKFESSFNGFTQEVELEDDQRENLSFISINGGIRFYL